MNTAYPARRVPFAWRAMTSTLIAIAFIVMANTGVVLFVSPPGRIANWTNWNILGLRKHEWIGIHIWFSLLFLLAALAHLFFNWRPLLNYFKDRLTRRLAPRREWVVALSICVAVYAGTRAGVQPFSSLLAFNERVKESWERPAERAPVPHAELLTLGELVTKAGVDMTTASNRLHASGIKDFTPGIIVQTLADNNRRPANEIYRVLMATAAGVKDSGGTQGHGGGYGAGGGYGGGGGKGAGPGRKTLTEYCVEEKIPIADALARLEARGIQAKPEMTLREIAINNGYGRPYELLEILHAQ